MIQLTQSWRPVPFRLPPPHPRHPLLSLPPHLRTSLRQICSKVRFSLSSHNSFTRAVSGCWRNTIGKSVLVIFCLIWWNSHLRDVLSCPDPTCTAHFNPCPALPHPVLWHFSFTRPTLLSKEKKLSCPSQFSLVIVSFPFHQNYLIAVKLRIQLKLNTALLSTVRSFVRVSQAWHLTYIKA